MPVTPFHLGPALLLAALLYRRIDLPTVLLASVVIDVRATLVMVGVLTGSLHGILTTFAGATVVAAVTAAAVWPVRSRIDAVTPPALRQAYRPATVVLGAVLGCGATSCWTRCCTPT